MNTQITPEVYRRDQYGKKQRGGECSVFYNLGEVRMAVEHITQDTEDGVYFAHLKGLDTPLMLNDEDRLIVEWRTLLNEVCNYTLQSKQRNYQPTLEEEVQQQYSRVFEAGAALSPFDQVRIMANEIESLREKHNHLALELASMEQSFKGASQLAADNMRDRDAARTELDKALTEAIEANLQLRANEQFVSEMQLALSEVDEVIRLHLPKTAELPFTTLRKFKALLDLMAAQRAALDASSAELEQARRWASTWKRRAKLYWKSSPFIRRKLKPVNINGENNHA